MENSILMHLNHQSHTEGYTSKYDPIFGYSTHKCIHLYFEMLPGCVVTMSTYGHICNTLFMDGLQFLHEDSEQYTVLPRNSLFYIYTIQHALCPSAWARELTNGLNRSHN